MLAHHTPAAVTGARPLELRIQAEGEIDDALAVELGGLTMERVPGGAVLTGTVVDAAEFWGVLHRLHRAGVKLRSVERLGPGGSSHRQTPVFTREAGCPSGGGGGVEVRIEVEGHAAGVMSVVLADADVYQTPPSTTLVMRVAGDDVLFSVLDLLEDLALDLRGIHVAG